MVIKNGKSAARRKSASSSPKSSRSNTVSKGSVRSCIVAVAAELDGVVDIAETTALESQTGDRILEETRTAEGTSGDDLSSQLLELTAMTLHQPWASLIAAGKKQYETRSWETDYRGPIAIHAGKKFEQDESLISLLGIPAAEVPLGAVVAIADLTDCIEMTSWFIAKVSMTEKALGDFRKGRYAWKLENVRAIEPIPAVGKQGLWKWRLEQEQWENIQQSTVSSQQSTAKLEYFCLECKTWMSRNQIREEFFGDYQTQLCKSCLGEVYHELDNRSPQIEIEGQSLCNTLMDGSICAVESVPASPMQELNCGKDNLINSAKKTATAETFSSLDTLHQTEFLPMSTTLTMTMTQNQTSLLPVPPVSPSQLMENDLQQLTTETAFQQSLQQLEITSPNLPLSKTSSASSTVPILLATNQGVTSGTSSTPYRQVGTMRSGSVSGVTNSPLRGVGKGYLLLRSPGALSSTGAKSPPGKTRLEHQLQELNLISAQEVAAPEFLESGYRLPIGFTNLQENRTALELAQAQPQALQPQALQKSIAPKSESLQETAITAIDEKPSEMPLIGELQPLPSSELNICLTSLPNIGALTKSELISMAQEQHQLICVIERKEFELAIEKLHRVRLTGVYLQEFKKKCQYGEFENQLEQAGIGVRSAQNYMAIAKNWEIVEAKTKLVALLTEENQPAIGLKWALEAVRDEKKQLKSAAPPKDPDSWRTPNTKDQPVVSLVRQALGEIWLDPCSNSGSSSTIPAAVRYYKNDDGLAPQNIWNKTVFINPPFSDPLPWVERCCLEIARGNVSAAIMLLKSGTVSNVGTGELISRYASAVCHWRGRINFLNDDGYAVKGSDFDCVLVYFGDRLDLFRKAFAGRGTISTIDNHYSSVNKKYQQQPETYTSVAAEEKQMAGSLGLSNGRSVLPDMRDRDRDLMERHDPHTVTISAMTEPFNPIAQPEITGEIESISAEFQQAKSDSLNDYITAISGNITDFSDEQLKFLVTIAKKELNNRNHPEYFRQRPRKRQN
ncbi:DNA N-6-adenine-methyltransferase [Microcoleus anatoxicus PTRS2]|uniref:DNA N-6-adenine-methyltransferase n=2 Tax=Microcoleus TaxID=44471 RepID=A0ABU8YKC8_9CYAN